MKKVDDLLGPALELAQMLQIDGKEGAIDRRVNSDISSFGTAIMQCGLIPAVAMFSNSNSDAGDRTVKMLNIILKLTDERIEVTDFEKGKHLLTYVLDILDTRNNAKLHDAQRNIMSACVALKLAVRTFSLEEAADARS